MGVLRTIPSNEVQRLSGDIHLTRNECAFADVDYDLVKRLALAFMDGDCPCQAEWILREAADGF